MIRNLESAHRAHTQKKGFTLVELLVVIGIIALLISVLLPALRKAQAAGAAANCASNMRSLGIAIQAYANDYKGWAPRAAAGYSGNFWHVYDDYIWWQSNPQLLALDKSPLAPYLGVARDVRVGAQYGSGASLGWLAVAPPIPGSEKLQAIFRCPADVDAAQRPQWDPTREASFGGFHYSYSMNYWFNADPTANGNAGVTVPTNPNDGGGGAPRYKFNKIKRPSEKIMMGEENWPNDGYWVMSNWQPGVSGAGGGGGVGDDWITTRHGGSGNILFCDAHVERLSWKNFSAANFRNTVSNPFAQ